MSTSVLFRRLTWLLFAGLILFVVFTFDQHGISNDEEVQHVYGRLLLDFYRSGFTDLSAFDYRNLYLYGGLFDLIAALLEWWGLVWIWDLRHLLSAAFGLLGMVASYRLAKLLGGEPAGFLVVLLLAITGAWSGAMFTHTKDIPFAACMIWALYYTVRLVMALPKPSIALSIKLGVAVGLALGLRIGGAFAVIYLLLMVLLAGGLMTSGWAARWRYYGNTVLHLLPAGLTALLLMAICWPWSVMGPDHLLQAARAFSHFSFNMLTVLDGETMGIGAVPRSYLAAYLAVRLPELFLLGLLLIVIVALRQRRAILMALRHADARTLAWLTLVTGALFPLLFILLDRPALYNGIRHFTFILPPLAILAALGMSLTWQQLRGKWTRLTAALVALLLLANTSAILYQLHPYQYVYYNGFAGGLAEAEDDWEADYWSSSLREASEALEHYVPDDSRPAASRYKVAVCAEAIQADAYLDGRFQVTTDWVAADFFISTTSMHCDKVLQGKVIAEVERMDTRLAVVKDRRMLTGLQRRPRPAPR